MEHYNKLITLKEAKDRLGTGWNHIKNLVRAGALPGYSLRDPEMDLSQLGDDIRGIRVRESDVEAYIESLRVERPGA